MGIEWWDRFKKNRLGMAALSVVCLFCLVGIYAPFLASSKPLFVIFQGEPYFPVFRYLFYTEFFTKKLDLFFNIWIFTLPAILIAIAATRNRKRLRIVLVSALLVAHGLLFMYLAYRVPVDPAGDAALNQDRQQKNQVQVQKHLKDPAHEPWEILDWNFDVAHLSKYAQLNLVLKYVLQKAQQQRVVLSLQGTPVDLNHLPTLWQQEQDHERNKIEELKRTMQQSPPTSLEYLSAQSELKYLSDRDQWLEENSAQLKWMVMPLLRSFHWEDDAGGQQSLNQYISWWELTRINRKDLLAALIFGIRISLFVGLTAVGLALLIGVPIGAAAGYHGGRVDIAVSRGLEVWEAMPTFFMLLTMVAITQSKSIFLVIGVIGFFGWTGFSRYIRGEFFKQRNLFYVEACRALGFRDAYIIFVHILPNAIPPLLTLLPFAVMEAITSEAGLSFLGLGEEGSCSWGVLMDEGRTAFPGESYLLWPPAILLTILLIAIALVGDRLRDALDPKKAV